MIYVTSDHGGYTVKQKLVQWLVREGYRVVDLGPYRRDSNDDYPVWAARLARHVARHPTHQGLAICRSGVGMAMVANKVPGIRAAQAFTPAMAKQSRRDENANVLSLAADYHTWPALQRMITAWLTTPYRPTRRFQRRLRQVARLEHGR